MRIRNLLRRCPLEAALQLAESAKPDGGGWTSAGQTDPSEAGRPQGSEKSLGRALIGTTPASIHYDSRSIENTTKPQCDSDRRTRFDRSSYSRNPNKSLPPENQHMTPRSSLLFTSVSAAAAVACLLTALGFTSRACGQGIAKAAPALAITESPDATGWTIVKGDR